MLIVRKSNMAFDSKYGQSSRAALWLVKTVVPSDPAQPMKSLAKKAIFQASVRVCYGWSDNRQTWADLKFWDRSWLVNVRGKYLKISFSVRSSKDGFISCEMKFSVLLILCLAWLSQASPISRKYAFIFNIVAKIRDRTQNKLVPIHGGRNCLSFLYVCKTTCFEGTNGLSTDILRSLKHNCSTQQLVQKSPLSN